MLEEKLAVYSATADEMLKTLLNGREMSDVLRESMSYSVFAGGKRLRPSLCMAACELVGGDAEDALLSACALEMIHTYSLIHDDLPALDNDDLRRGKPSNHVAFGEANAIIAGDGLQALAFVTAAKTENPRVVQALADGAFNMVVGQSYDLGACGDAEMLHTIHKNKTGALILASVLCGAYCAQPTELDIDALTRYAEHFGLLFQITDDILDVEGDAAVLGKSIGKDAMEDKLTFVTLLGLDGAKEQAKREAELAKNALEHFGTRAAFFTELADYTLTRRH